MAKFTGHTITSDSALGAAKIQRSLRFYEPNPSNQNSTAATNLTRTPSSTGNRKIWTFSSWIKKFNGIGTGNDSAAYIYGAYSGSDYFSLYFQEDQLYSYYSPGNNYGSISDRKFRDTSSWFHLVHQVDATNTVQKIWINGEELSLNSGRNPGNSDYPMNQSGVQLVIGKASWKGQGFNGYLAETHLIDGSLIAPTEFGFTDPVTNIWMPKRFDKSNIPNKKGTTFSGSGWTVSGGGGFSGSKPITNAYNGSIGTSNSDVANNSAGGAYLTWDTSAYNLTGNLKIFCWSDGGEYDIYVNGNSGSTTKVGDTPSGSGNAAWIDCGTFSHIKEIQFSGTTYNTDTGLGSSGVYIAGFLVNGTLLRDDMPEYGTNGFYLDFSDNTNTTTLGIDKSPNGNDFTLNNFSVAAWPDNDSVIDTPTNNFNTFNDNDRNSNVPLANGGLETAATATGGHYPAFTTIPMKSGKWYLEWKFLTNDSGLPSIMEAVHDGNSYNTDSTVGNNTSTVNKRGYGFQTGNGNKKSASGNESYGSALTSSDTGQCAFDADTGKIYWGKNNTWFASGNPETGANPAFSGIDMTKEYLFTWHVYGNNNNVSVNFGSQGFTYTPPSGFKALCTENLSLKQTPSAIKPQKHFETLLYTGTGSSNSITGLEFSPDLIWAKRRDTSGHHNLLIDTIRGGSKSLQANTADPENSNANRDMTFLSNGIRWNSDTGNANANGGTYAVWCWKGGGAAVSNTDGSVTSTVSANQEAGFSIVQFEAQTTSTNITVGHGLGKKPEFWMWKSIDNTIDWYNYHKDIGYNGWLNNSTTAAATTGNDAAWKAEPTSTVFTHGSGLMNQNTILMYLWTSIPGYSKIGSYTGNGSTTGNYVHCGFRPRWIMTKRVSGGTGNWYIWDTAREFNVNNSPLQANASDSEPANYDNSIDILSDGFKLRASNAGTNSSGDTYMFMAFAEQSGVTPFDTFPNAL